MDDSSEEISERMIARLKEQLKQWATANDPSGFLNIKRTITLTYRGFEFQSPAEDLGDEIRLRIYAWVKSLASGSPVLPVLAPEPELFETSLQKTKVFLSCPVKGPGGMSGGEVLRTSTRHPPRKVCEHPCSPPL